MANENQVEIKPKRRKWPNVGKTLQRNAKDLNACTPEKEAKGKDQGQSKDELSNKSLDVVDAVGGHKGQKMSKWDNYSAPVDSKLGETQVLIGLQPPLYNVIWQVCFFLFYRISFCIQLFRWLIISYLIPWGIRERFFGLQDVMARILLD